MEPTKSLVKRQSVVNSHSIASAETKAKTRRGYSRRRSGVFLFRALVRKVIGCLPWLADTTNLELGPNALRNAFIITHRKTGKQILTLDDKLELKKPVHLRKDEVIDSINRKIGMLKAFKNYPEKIRYQLLKNAGFECWKQDRVIIKQGHVGQAVYFIVEGTAECKRVEPDPVFPDDTVTTIDMFTEGEGFGEVSLLYEEPHSITVTVKSEHAEMIVLKKEYFTSILESTLKKQWNSVRWALAKLPYFSQFPESAIRMLCSFCNLQMIRPNSVIQLRDATGTEVVTFIIEGTCQVIQTLWVTQDHTKLDFEKRYRLYRFKSKIDEESLPPKNVIPIFMQTCTLQRRSVIGLERYNIANIWMRTVTIIDMLYPAEDYIFNKFISYQKWLKYRREVKKDTKYKELSTYMTIHDTPISTRAKSLKIKPKLFNRITTMKEYKFGEMDVEESLERFKAQREECRINYLARVKHQRFASERFNQKINNPDAPSSITRRV